MKKILLVLSMFLFMTNVKALTFNVNLTNIEDKGNNGTIGSIEKIDLENKEIDAYFQDIGDEVSFSVTISNTGDRAGTLKSIEATSSGESIEYTSNLPEGGLAISANDTNEVIITAKVKEGAVNGKTSSEVKIKYSYDEGSCPDGEILSDDESMCLCPEGLERGDSGVCVKPSKDTTECKDGEVYNESKKICEKKVTPVSPSNPKTMDNIVLITLLFFVSGLGIYAVLYKKLQTKKKKITVGVITGIITLTASFTVLASMFGLDNLLSAIINPITKSKEIVLTVNEEIELIETWDGECSLEVSDLTPSNIFEGGSGTESDPYQIKTAEQLSCLAKSVNNGTTYEGKYIKQTKNIKLNNKVLENVENNTLTDLNTWIPIGELERIPDSTRVTVTKSFNGTYDGDNKVISGLYINDSTADYLGLFKAVDTAAIKNLTLSDTYINGNEFLGTLVAMVESQALENGSYFENIKTYGKINGKSAVTGMIGNAVSLPNVDNTKIVDSENYVEVTASGDFAAGFAFQNINLINSKNYGNVTALQNTVGMCGYNCYIIESENHGEITGEGYVSGIGRASTVVMSSDNYGKIVGKIITGSADSKNGFVGISLSGTAIDCNNYGDIDTTLGSAAGIAYGGASAYKSGNTGTITVHDNDPSVTQIAASGIVIDGTPIISDEDLASFSVSYFQRYNDIMGKEFVPRNKENYNSGDIYITDVNTTRISVSMVGTNGCSQILNAKNTGSMYITNATASDSVFTVIGTDGSRNTNVTSTGDLIIDNFSGGSLLVSGIGTNGSTSTNTSSEGTIEIKNSTFGIGDGYVGRAFVTGGTTSGANMIESYTTGDILIHDNHFEKGLDVATLTASGSGSTRSYSEKNVEIYNNTGLDLSVAAFGTSGGSGVTDSYNRGNIDIYDNEFNTILAGARTGSMSLNGGNYNSGDVYVKDNYATKIQLGGAEMGPFFSNFYNLGDITLETENNTRLTTLDVGGVNILNFGDYYTNLVNAGNITIPYVSSVTSLSVGGVFAKYGPNPSAKNVYNLGTITIGEGYTYSDAINYGNIVATTTVTDTPSTTAEAYYTQDGYAMGLSRIDSNYRAIDSNFGVKISASQAPSILSIINVNDVFEIKEGAELPTLKVFNQ